MIHTQMRNELRSVKRVGGGAIAALIALGCLSVVTTAEAAGPSGWCPLSRSPYLVDSSLPPELRCKFDQDGNGLDDEVEREIARCIVPVFAYDSGELWRRDTKGHFRACTVHDDSDKCKFGADWGNEFSGELIAEPNVVFDAFQSEPSILAVRFAMLWGADGGFATDNGLLGCQDTHLGDCQNIAVWAKVIRGSSGWGVTVDRADNATQDHTPYAFENMHAIVYASAGKHHPYGAPKVSSYDISGGGSCKDSARGDGPLVQPGDSSSKAMLAQIPFNFVGLSESGAWLNACEAAKGKVVEISLDNGGFQSDSLLNMGYAFANGDPARIQDYYFFRNDSVPVKGVRTNLADACGVVPDGDKDGKAEIISVEGGTCVIDLHENCNPFNSLTPPTSFCPYPQCSDLKPKPGAIFFPALNNHDNFVDFFWISQPTDRCPLGPDGDDTDGDQLFGLCDPDPNFRNTYVAGGSGELHAFDRLEALTHNSTGMWINSQNKSTFPKDGYLDHDRDGLVDGNDMCPNTEWGGGIQYGSSNLWGERVDFPYGSSDGAYNLGAFHRGNSCDPYPVTKVSWGDDAIVGQSTPQVAGHCSNDPHFGGGSETMTVSHELRVGRSENDPGRGDAVQPTRTVTAQTRRCACLIDNGLDQADATKANCLLDPKSDCYAPDLRVADDAPQRGRGWRPVSHASCSLGSGDFCAPELKSLTPYTPTSWEFQWNWREEAKNSGAHFADGDIQHNPEKTGPSGMVERTSYDESTYRYALWSVIEEGPDSLGEEWAKLPPKKGYFWEPEMTTEGAALNSTVSVFSRRLRSTFAPPMRLISDYQGLDFTKRCAIIENPFIRYFEMIWKVDPGPEKDIGVHKNLLDHAQFLASTGPLATDLLLPRPQNKGYQVVKLTGETQSTWLAGSSGLSAMQATKVAHQSPTTTGLQAGSTQPSILWVDQNSQTGKWALLSPAESSETEVFYVFKNQGELGSPVGRQASLLAEAQGQGAILLDPDSQSSLVFDYETESWNSVTLPPALLTRQGAAKALFGSVMVAVGGTDLRAGLQSEGWIVDITSGLSVPTEAGFPARENARLAVSSDGRSFMLAGGKDATGNHDELWIHNLDKTSARAKLLRADTSKAAAFVPALTVLSASESSLVAVVADAANPGSFPILTRTSAGWVDTSPGQSSTCQDPKAGTLCKLDANWWANPGVTTCKADASLSCEGVKGVLGWVATLGANLIDAKVDETGIWLLTKTSVSHWISVNSGQPQLSAQKAIPSQDYRLAVANGQVLLLSSAGVSLVRDTKSAITVGQTTALCGRPLTASPLGNGVWAVLTTLGLAVVDTSDSVAPKLLSMSGLIPMGDSAGWAAPLPIDSKSLAHCAQLDKFIPAAFLPILRQGMAVSGLDAKHAAAVVGPFLYVLNFSHPKTPEVTDMKSLLTLKPALKWNSSGQFLFVAGDVGKNQFFQVVDGELQNPRIHDLGDWVKRSDVGNFSLRLKGAKAEIARVIR